MGRDGTPGLGRILTVWHSLGRNPVTFDEVIFGEAETRFQQDKPQVYEAGFIPRSLLRGASFSDSASGMIQSVIQTVLMHN